MAQALALTLDSISADDRHMQHLLAHYEQHFAGRPRATRDVRALGEIIESLDRLHGIRPRWIDRALTALREEHDQIVAAYRDGDPPGRSVTLAARASELFALYRRQIAGRAHLACRPALLRRVIISLRDIQADMSGPAFRALPEPDIHHSNLQIVDRTLTGLQHELARLEQAHEKATRAERDAALRAAVEEAVGCDGQPVMRWIQLSRRTPESGGRDDRRDPVAWRREALRDRCFELELQLFSAPRCAVMDVQLERIQDEVDRLSTPGVIGHPRDIREHTRHRDAHNQGERTP